MSSKAEIIAEIDNSHPHLAHEIAAKHGGVLVDLECKTPKCGERIARHWVAKPISRDGKIEDEFRYQVCPKCGVKGQFNWKYSKEPLTAQVEKAKEDTRVEEQKKVKTDIFVVEDQIEQLRAKKESLLEKLGNLFKPNAIIKPEKGKRSKGSKI